MKGKGKSIIRNISYFLKNHKTLSNLKIQPIKLIKRNSKSKKLRKNYKSKKGHTNNQQNPKKRLGLPPQKNVSQKNLNKNPKLRPTLR
jgi:hypothetical protein